MPSIFETLSEPRRKEIASIEELLWGEVLLKNPKNYFLAVPNELFLLFGIVMALAVLAFSVGSLDISDTEALDLGDLQNGVVGAFGASILCILVAVVHRVQLSRYNSKVEKDFYTALKQVITRPEQSEDISNPSVPIDIPDEFFLHLKQTVDNLNLVTRSLDNLPDMIVSQNTNEFEKVLDSFSARIQKLPGELDEVLKKNQVEVNDEKRLFRDAVSTMANWTPEFEEIKDQLVTVSKQMKISEETFSNNLNKLNQNMKNSLDKTTDSLKSISSEVSVSISNFSTEVNRVNQSITQVSTNLDSVGQNIIKTQDNLSGLAPLFDSLKDLTGSLKVHVDSFDSYIEKVTHEFGQTFTEKMGETIDSMGSNVSDTFNRQFAVEIKRSLNTAVEESNLKMKLDDLERNMSLLNQVVNSVKNSSKEIETTISTNMNSISSAVSETKTNQGELLKGNNKISKTVETIKSVIEESNTEGGRGGILGRIFKR